MDILTRFDATSEPSLGDLNWNQHKYVVSVLGSSVYSVKTVNTVFFILNWTVLLLHLLTVLFLFNILSLL